MNQRFSALLAALVLSTGLPAIAAANQPAGIPSGAPLRAASATAAAAETPKDVLLRVQARRARAAARIASAAGHFNLPWALATDNNGASRSSTLLR